MDKCLIGLARKMLGVRGVYEYQGGKRQRSNKEVREMMRMSCMGQELRVRRLKWLGCMLEAPEENVQLRAALGGPIRVGGVVLGGEYVPWLGQMVEDIRWYLDATEGIGRGCDVERCREGRRLLEEWEAAGCRWKVLDGTKMRWFRWLTTYPEDIKDSEDPRYNRAERRTGGGEEV